MDIRFLLPFVYYKLSILYADSIVPPFSKSKQLKLSPVFPSIPVNISSFMSYGHPKLIGYGPRNPGMLFKTSEIRGTAGMMTESGRGADAVNMCFEL